MSFVPVRLKTTSVVTSALCSSLTVTVIVTCFVSPSSSDWYASSDASKLYEPVPEFNINPAVVGAL